MSSTSSHGHSGCTQALSHPKTPCGCMCICLSMSPMEKRGLLASQQPLSISHAALGALHAAPVLSCSVMPRLHPRFCLDPNSGKLFRCQCNWSRNPPSSSPPEMLPCVFSTLGRLTPSSSPDSRSSRGPVTISLLVETVPLRLAASFPTARSLLLSLQCEACDGT